MHVIVDQDAITLYDNISRVTKINGEIKNENLKCLTVGVMFTVAIRLYNRNEYRVAIGIYDCNPFKLKTSFMLDINDFAEFNKIEHT